MVYFLQIDSDNLLSFDFIEKLGDYCIYKNNYIINSDLSKLKIINKLKRVLSKCDQVFVKEIQEFELDNYPFIVKEWFFKNLQKQQTINSNNRIELNYDLIKQDAINRLNLLLDSVKEELDIQIKSKKEV